MTQIMWGGVDLRSIGQVTCGDYREGVKSQCQWGSQSLFKRPAVGIISYHCILNCRYFWSLNLSCLFFQHLPPCLWVRLKKTFLKRIIQKLWLWSWLAPSAWSSSLSQFLFPVVISTALPAFRPWEKALTNTAALSARQSIMVPKPLWKTSKCAAS